MARWAGIGARIRARLLQMGYEKNGRADITRFCLEHRLLPTNVYRWVNADVLPERDNLLRLAGLLGVSPGWLLFGEEPEAAPAAKGERKRRRPVPISGGSDADQALGVPSNPLLQVLSTLGSPKTARVAALCQVPGLTAAWRLLHQSLRRLMVCEWEGLACAV